MDRPPRERSEVLVNKPEDVAFVRQLVEQVEAWRQVSRVRCVLHCEAWLVSQVRMLMMMCCFLGGTFVRAAVLRSCTCRGF